MRVLRRGSGKGRTRGGVSASVCALLALVTLAVGLSGGFLLTRSRIPTSLVSSTEPGSMTVSQTMFDDTRTVALTVTLGASTAVTSPRSGTLTSTACARGATITTGGAPLTIDATPVPALHTAVPPYRPLTSGDHGPDAAALNDALRALGYAAGDSDWFTWDTISAYNALADTLGARRITADDQWTLDTAAYLWLPDDTVSVASCAASVGQRIDAGQELFATSATPQAATLPATTGQQVAGERLLTIGDQSFTIAAGTTGIDDPALLGAIGASSEFFIATLGAQQHGDGTVSVSYQWRLATPLPAITVPPTALYDAEGDAACVSVDGTPAPVRIIASQLGATMVTPDGTDPFGTVDVAPADPAPCRAG